MPWFRDPARHALAAKGIPTSRIEAAQLECVERGNRVRSAFGQRFGYAQRICGLRRRYDELDEVERKDYEKAVQPIFDALAEADLLADGGNFKEAVTRLKLASDEYARLLQDFNVINDDDSKEFLAVTHAISQKTIAKARVGAIPPPKAPDKPMATVSQTDVDDKSGVDERESR